MTQLFSKHFAVDEADALLPHILSTFEKMRSFQAELEAKKESLDQIHHAAPGNGGSRKGHELVQSSESITRLIAGLENLGIIVKDLENGLVDFPHILDGREVFLCWRIGEKSVTQWHELDAGFRGRQPL